MRTRQHGADTYTSSTREARANFRLQETARTLLRCVLAATEGTPLIDFHSQYDGPLSRSISGSQPCSLNSRCISVSGSHRPSYYIGVSTPSSFRGRVGN